MGRAVHPNNWPRIERAVKVRADFRCECGMYYDCNGTHHHGRCPNVEGNRYAHNKRLVGLRVVQIKRGADWRPKNLVALCLPCHMEWAKSEQAEIREDAEDGLFDHLHS